jgi:hypothetical protein
VKVGVIAPPAERAPTPVMSPPPGELIGVFLRTIGEGDGGGYRYSERSEASVKSVVRVSTDILAKVEWIKGETGAGEGRREVVTGLGRCWRTRTSRGDKGAWRAAGSWRPC